jgi:hypothetical protein
MRIPFESFLKIAECATECSPAAIATVTPSSWWSTPMFYALWAVAILAGLGSLTCFILVIVKMFQMGDSTLGIVCVVTIFCCIGGLLTYIMGWVKSSDYGVLPIMLIWTVCIGIGIACRLAMMALVHQ